MYLGPPWPIRSSNMSVGVRAHISTLAFYRLRMSVKMPKKLQTLLKVKL